MFTEKVNTTDTETMWSNEKGHIIQHTETKAFKRQMQK